MNLFRKVTFLLFIIKAHSCIGAFDISTVKSNVRDYIGNGYYTKAIDYLAVPSELLQR